MTRMTIEQAIELGRQQHQAGQLAEAESIYRQILASQPQNPDALHLLGVVAFQTGNAEGALNLLRKAVELCPTDLNYRTNLAKALAHCRQFDEALATHQTTLESHPDSAETFNAIGDVFDSQGKMDEAIEAFRRALAIRPDFADAHNNLGVSLQRSGHKVEAAATFREALRYQPDFPLAKYNLGELLRSEGRLEEAIATLRQAASLWPDSADVHYSLGRALHADGKYDDAADSFRRALSLRPNFADASNYLGICLNSIGRHIEAIHAFNGALAAQPRFPEALSNLGSALQSAGQLEAAIRSYRRAIEEKPDFTDAWRNLGLALAESGELGPAIEAHRAAIRINPAFADGHNSLGGALHSAGRFDEAIAAFAEAIRLKPEFVLAHYNLGLLLLLRGRLEEGWPEYEWRCRDPEISIVSRELKQPRWAGESLAGKRLLVHSEQGLGDTIQFVRYLPQIADRGATIFLQVQPELTMLFDGLAGVERVIARGAELPEFDLRCSLLSLPMLLGTSPDNIPAKVPYLKANEPSSARWREHLAGDKKRVGLVWAGGAAHANDRNRSIPLSAMASLLQVAGAQFVSLQKGPQANQIRQAADGMSLTDLSDQLHNFAETAGVIDNLDLVITVDTAVAHLAGAMGKPVWVLLPFVPDWRWMLGRNDSPWYPRMRLFRQPAIGDWKTPLARVVDELQLLIRG